MNSGHSDSKTNVIVAVSVTSLMRKVSALAVQGADGGLEGHRTEGTMFCIGDRSRAGVFPLLQVVPGGSSGLEGRECMDWSA